MNELRRRPFWRIVCSLVLASTVLAGGCSDDATRKAIDDFQVASGALAGAYGTFLVSANTVEEEHYIDGLTTPPTAFDETAMLGKDVVTTDQIALRTAAITTLGKYTALLAKLAGGESAKAIETDAQAASVNVGALTGDVQAAVEKHTGTSGEALSGPVTAAMSAVGSVLKLVEEHRARKEIKESILANDPAISKLYEMIGVESRVFYARQKQSLSDQEVLAVHAFDEAAGKGGDTGRLLALGDRLKKARRASALQAQANPHDAIAAFQMSHDKLIDLIKNGSQNRTTLQSLTASAESFAAEVGPLAGSLQALIASL